MARYTSLTAPAGVCPSEGRSGGIPAFKYSIDHQWQCDAGGDISCIRGAVGNGQTLCEALPGSRSRGFFCACQEALSQQIDCGSLPRGPSIIGPGGGGAGSRSATGDLG